MNTSSLLWWGFLFYYLYKINWNPDAFTGMVWLTRFIYFYQDDRYIEFSIPVMAWSNKLPRP